MMMDGKEYFEYLDAASSIGRIEDELCQEILKNNKALIDLHAANNPIAKAMEQNIEELQDLEGDAFSCKQDEIDQAKFVIGKRFEEYLVFRDSQDSKINALEKQFTVKKEAMKDMKKKSGDFTKALNAIIENCFFHRLFTKEKDYILGPPGCRVLRNITNLWRQHFMVKENMTEVSYHGKVMWMNCGKVSMVKDTSNICYRADGTLASKLKSPSDPYLVDLICPTQIGSSDANTGYESPHTPGVLYSEYVVPHFGRNGDLGVCENGIVVSRNKRSSKGGIINASKFNVLEIEQFLTCTDNCSKFLSVSDLELFMHSSNTEFYGQHSLQEAVSKGIVNQTLAYFMGQVALFLTEIGISEKYVRFIQNRLNKTAMDCWDVEILSSEGWIECVVIADRSANMLCETLKVMEQKQRVLGTKVMEEKRTPSLVELSFAIERIIYCMYEQVFCFRMGTKEARGMAYLAFKPSVAPYKCVIFKVHKNPDSISNATKVDQRAKQKINQVFEEVYQSLKKTRLEILSDDKIGTPIQKRYERADELGVLYSVTVDSRAVSEEVSIRYLNGMAENTVKSKDAAPRVLLMYSSLFDGK